MGFVATVVEKDHLSVIEWRGRIVVGGKSPRREEFLDYLDNAFDWPVAVKPTEENTTTDFDVVRRPAQNSFELARVALHMAQDLDLEVLITEEI